jgi:hypothetical protein
MEILQNLREWKAYIAAKRLERKRERREGAFVDRWAETARPFESVVETRELECAAQLRARERQERWSALTWWVGEACKYLKTPIYTDDEGRMTTLEASLERISRDHLLGHFVVLSDEEIKQGLAKPGGNLDPCQIGLINTIRLAPGPMDPAWLLAMFDENRPRRTAKESRSGGEKFDQALAVIVRGISDGVVKLVSGITHPFIYYKADGEASDERPASSYGGKTYSDHSQSAGTDLGEAHRQLKGIAGSSGVIPSR